MHASSTVREMLVPVAAILALAASAAAGRTAGGTPLDVGKGAHRSMLQQGVAFPSALPGVNAADDKSCECKRGSPAVHWWRFDAERRAERMHACMQMP